MADQSLGKDDCLDDSDEGIYEQGDGPNANEKPSTPFQRFIKYAWAEEVYNRRAVAVKLLKIFQTAPTDAVVADLPVIMDVFGKLVNDDEVMVRMDSLEHIPNLASMVQNVPALAHITGEYLLSMVVNNLGDSDSQVRKSAQRALLTLLERGLVSKAQAEIKVCPTILALTRQDPMTTDGVTLMVKTVPLLGRDVTERVFFDRFVELCSEIKFFMRRICASYIGDFCTIISWPLFEKVLFVTYTKLCNDEAWGVRKACADVAQSVSCACSPELRKTVLAPIFARLLCDKCRWVRISAFQTLGPFIATFAEPTITSLAYNEQGELVLVSGDSEFKINNNSSTPNDGFKSLFYLCLDDLTDADYEDPLGLEEEPPPPEDAPPQEDSLQIDQFLKVLSQKEVNLDLFPVINTRGEKNVIGTEKDSTKCDNLGSEISAISSQLSGIGIRDSVAASGARIAAVEQLEKGDQKTSAQTDHSSSSSLGNIQGDGESNSGGALAAATPEGNNNDDDGLALYNSHNYWYVPPDMPLDPNIVAGNETEKTASDIVHILEQEKTDAFCKTDFETNNLNETVIIASSAADVTYDASAVEQDDILLDGESADLYELKEPPQKIVPQLLIDHFISMADPNIAKSVDDKVAYHCAYSLPAVAVTLGSDNSHLLKPIVESLAANMQYKVRHTLASSLHELARIWGTDVASNDLTPIFNDFINDLDEVRIGILQNLSKFLRVISPSKRSLYLPRLSYFLQNSQKLNWRYRHELAEQLVESVTMFTPQEASKHIAHIAQRLLCDKVAAVRQMAIKLVAQLLRHINNEPGLSSRLLIKFAETFAHSKKWKLRQMYVFLGCELLVSQALPMDQYVCEVMPHLLDLSWDPVANVKLMVAQTIVTHMINNEYFRDPENQLLETLESVVRRLQTDKDHDVRQSAVPKPYSSDIAY